jgi:hypothetical protein
MASRLPLWFRTLARVVAGGTVAAVLGLAPALADNTVRLTIVGDGPMTAMVVDATLPQIAYSNEPQQVSGLLSLVISDSRGTSVGWSVAVASTDFIYHGDSPSGRDIPNEGFRILAVAAPVVVAGQPVGAGGPHVGPLAGASLDTPRTVIWAEPGAGSGDYALRIGVVLDVPVRSQVGIYLATLTIAFTAAP